MSDITQLLDAAATGDSQATSELLPLVYNELRRLAASRIAAEGSAQTLQATALVHEAYVRLVDVPDARPWQGRAHFFAAAAEAMRRILIEAARRKGRQKHGGRFRRIELDDLADNGVNDQFDDILALDEALTALAQEDPEKAEIVKLRYFGGLSLDMAAGLLGISLATAKRRWTVARAWLFDRLSDDNP